MTNKSGIRNPPPPPPADYCGTCRNCLHDVLLGGVKCAIKSVGIKRSTRACIEYRRKNNGH